MAAVVPILKKADSLKKEHARAHWDEANLDENEKIKLELAPQKITEPKTPYHAPLQGNLDDVEPLSLEGEEIKHGEGFKKHMREHYKKEAEALKKAAAAADEEEEEEEK